MLCDKNVKGLSHKTNFPSYKSPNIKVIQQRLTQKSLYTNIHIFYL